MVFMSSNAKKMHFFPRPVIQCNDRKSTNNNMSFFQLKLYAMNGFISHVHPTDEAVCITQSK